jgi:hypothetical protein
MAPAGARSPEPSGGAGSRAASRGANELLEAWRAGPNALAVHRLRIGALESYGSTLADDLALATLVGLARRILLEETVIELSRRGIESCDAVLADLAKSRRGRDSGECLLVRLRKAVFLRERGAGHSRGARASGPAGACSPRGSRARLRLRRPTRDSDSWPSSRWLGSTSCWTSATRRRASSRNAPKRRTAPPSIPITA